jgi:hypothetical protein
MPSYNSKYYSVGSRDQFIRKKMRLEFEHVPTGKKVFFPAFIEMFSDAYNSNWNAEDVYGRMDPVANFINTRRALAVSWNVPADSYEHAAQNVAKMNRLISFLYPLYDTREGSGATTINQGPLMRIRFGNLIRNAENGSGLLGYVNGFTFDPDFAEGVFYGKNNVRDLQKAATFAEQTGEPGRAAELRAQAKSIQNVEVEYLPKTFRVNFEFNVLHEHSLGFQISSEGAGSKVFTFGKKDQNLGDMNFPYSVSTTPEIDGDADTQSYWDRRAAASAIKQAQRRQAEDEVAAQTQGFGRQHAQPGTVEAKLAQTALDQKGIL